MKKIVAIIMGIAVALTVCSCSEPVYYSSTTDETYTFSEVKEIAFEDMTYEALTATSNVYMIVADSIV